MCPAIRRVLADEVSTRDADPGAIDQQADDFAAVLYRLAEFLRGVAVFFAAAGDPRTVLERTVVHAALVDVPARAHRHEQQQGKEHVATSKHFTALVRSRVNGGMRCRGARRYIGMIAPRNANLQAFFCAARKRADNASDEQ